MANNRKSYNAVIRALKRKDLNQAQARVAWRALYERLARSPRVADLQKHPRITAQEVKRAPARERALRAAKTRKAKATAKVAPVITGTIVLPTKAESPVKQQGKGRGRAQAQSA